MYLSFGHKTVPQIEFSILRDFGVFGALEGSTFKEASSEHIIFREGTVVACTKSIFSH